MTCPPVVCRERRERSRHVSFARCIFSVEAETPFWNRCCCCYCCTWAAQTLERSQSVGKGWGGGRVGGRGCCGILKCESVCGTNRWIKGGGCLTATWLLHTGYVPRHLFTSCTARLWELAPDGPFSFVSRPYIPNLFLKMCCDGSVER